MNIQKYGLVTIVFFLIFLSGLISCGGDEAPIVLPILTPTEAGEAVITETQPSAPIESATTDPIVESATAVPVLEQQPTETPVNDVETASDALAATCNPPPGWVIYNVQPGNTLFSLARWTNITLEQLQQANCLNVNETLIYAGQPIYLPFIPTQSPTSLPVPAVPVPPRISNDIPSGVFPENHVVANLIADNHFLFRLEVYDTNVGNVDGAGIVSVKFVINGEGGTLYTSTERTPGYCIFRGGEPTCNPWVIEDGRYRWGNGGPEVISGDYSAAIYVTPVDLSEAAPLDDPESPVWGWFFNFHVDVP